MTTPAILQISPVSGATPFTPAIASAGGALGAYTIVSARYWLIGSLVRYEVEVTITDIGTATGGLFMALPVPIGALSSSLGVGLRTSDSLLLTSVLLAAVSATTTRYTKTDGTSPISATTFILTGMYSQ